MSSTDPHAVASRGVADGLASPIVERAGDIALVIGCSGLITSWNEAARELYGFDASTVVGQPMLTLVPTADTDHTLALWARAAGGEIVRDVPVKRRCLDGSIIELIVEVGPVPSARVPERAVASEPGSPTTDNGLRGLETVLAHFEGVVFQLDVEGTFTFCAGRGLAALGIEPGDVIGVKMLDLVEGEAGHHLASEILAGRPVSGPYFLAGLLWDTHCEPIHDASGAFIGSGGLMTSGQAEWEHHEALALTEARFKALAQHSNDLVAVIGPDLVVTYVSPSIEWLLGYKPADIIGSSVEGIVHRDDLPLVGRRSRRSPTSDPRNDRFELRLHHLDGTWRQYELINSDYLADPAVGGIVINGHDITERIDNEQRMRHASMHDALTLLPNRSLLLDHIDRVIHDELSARPAVVVIGLDRFKLVNDSLGHAAGDAVLTAVADRLRRAVRPGDIVGRLSGDMFVVAATLDDAQQAGVLAGRLLGVLTEPLEIGSRRIAITASGGAAVHSVGEDAPTVVRNAETAMYRAKDSHRNHVEIYVPAMSVRADRLLELEQSLKRAVVDDQLRVHYQPVITLHNSTVMGVEALVRWEHPELGLVPPLDFIPLAEETGYIVEIGEWVLRESCHTAAAWARAGKPLHMSVNLSPRQLVEPDLPEVVASILEETGLPATSLTMEVTESVLVDEGDFATATLAKLRAMGVHLAIDDFGTGYSSLVYLRRLRVDSLKIDRSFVNGLGEDAEDDAIVKTIINLAQSLGLDLVAEGVETEHQRAVLRSLGCRFAQGYLFSRPLERDAFDEWYAGVVPDDRRSPLTDQS